MEFLIWSLVVFAGVLSFVFANRNVFDTFSDSLVRTIIKK